jgi:hypothetical protein
MDIDGYSCFFFGAGYGWLKKSERVGLIHIDSKSDPNIASRAIRVILPGDTSFLRSKKMFR